MPAAPGPRPAANREQPGPGRWELARALGALAAAPPAQTARACRALGLPAWSAAEHTGLFVLALPPYASVYLGAEGKLGGEAADRVAGLWRALGLDPPSGADHLGMILALYAELGEAAATTGSERTRERLDRARQAVLWEHLWSWLPGYLRAAAAQDGVFRPWADLTLRVLVAEARRSPAPARLPLALRAAPAPITTARSAGDLLDAVTAPARAGFILTPADVAAAAGELGLGLRRGERRFAVRAMLEQDAAATTAWLASHAGTWAAGHRRAPAIAAGPRRWWAARSAASARFLRELAA